MNEVFKSIIKFIANGFILFYLWLRKKLLIRPRILFFGYSPMNYTMFRPLHKAIEACSSESVYFAFADDNDDYREYIELGVQRSNIIPFEKAVHGVWDAVFVSDFLQGRFRWKSRFIQVNHGVAAKEAQIHDSRGRPVMMDYRFHPQLKKYDLVFFPNHIVHSVAVERRLVRPDAGYVVGMCCLDELKENCSQANMQRIKDKYVPHNFEGKEIILYAPTFGNNASYIRRGDDILRALAEKDAFVIVKPHPRCLGLPVGGSNTDLKTFMQHHFPRHNYAIVTSTPYDVMPISDFIISDFSSIAFEYALLMHPIYLFVGDNLHTADVIQLEALKNCSFVFGEREPLEPAFFKKCVPDPFRINAMETLAETYFANYGTATHTAIGILLDKKIINADRNYKV